MNPGGDETDALLRQIRGYIRLWRDPPSQQGTTLEQTKRRAAELAVLAFEDLDKRLVSGELPPEEWDPLMGNTARDKTWIQGYVYVYPPGVSSPAPCTRNRKGKCDWLNPGATKTACTRCHTIRIRVADG